MFIILSVWEDLLFQASLKISISIGVISTLGYFHSKMLADYLKLFFNSNQIKIRDVKNRSDLAGNFNIVISNCSIPENALNANQVSLVINNFPSKQDIKQLQSIILDLL
ncbi:hypothetical protein N1495_08870 [Streptococcus didelphis]|nr:hypothetical protein [Streptococcus didelphis]WMB29402.1 hypothetical protein N1495_08870 [Streptococcus didelphis]